MTGLDTTALVQLCDASNPFHLSVTAKAEAEILLGNRLLVAPQVIAEFLHVITDARRFAAPLEMEQAVRWVDELLAAPHVELVPPSSAAIQQAHGWIIELKLGRKRLLDTFLAATLYTAGCRRLITSNPDDFRVFGVLDLIVS
jgi:predicted nucleic acid-binding protein